MMSPESNETEQSEHPVCCWPSLSLVETPVRSRRLSLALSLSRSLALQLRRSAKGRFGPR